LSFLCSFEQVFVFSEDWSFLFLSFVSTNLRLILSFSQTLIFSLDRRSSYINSLILLIA
jgi:hypothetical protein